MCAWFGHASAMNTSVPDHDPSVTEASGTLTRTLLSSLYAEALLLADEARAWFDHAMGAGGSALKPGEAMAEDLDQGLFTWAGRHDPSLRIALSCESLRLTTRLMHIIAWLLFQRAIDADEVEASAARDERNRLGPSPVSDMTLRPALPPEAQRLIENSERLYARVAVFDAALDGIDDDQAHPVRAMMGRLQSAL